MLARLDQPELATSEIFDRRWVAAETPRLLAQSRVLGALPLNLLLENAKFLSFLDGFEESFLPDEPVQEHDAADEEQCVLDRSSPSPACGAGGRCGR